MKKRSMAYAVMGLHSLTPIAFAHGPGEGHPVGPWMMWWGHGVGWWIFPLVMITVGIVVCLFLLGRRGRWSSWCGTDGRKEGETPLDILKTRYAKGEISKEEFETIKKDL